MATSAQSAVFERPDGQLIAGLGAIILLAGCGGVVWALVLVDGLDIRTLALIALGFVGACALGAGFINTWRTPLLTIRPEALTMPTFFGARDIPLRPGHPVGEFLATSKMGGRRRGGTVEGNKFVHFYTLDADGTLIEVLSLHRASPQIPEIRRAFRDVAGLEVETLERGPNATGTLPDVSHWHRR